MATPKLNPFAKIRVLSMQRSPSAAREWRRSARRRTSPDPAPLAASGATKRCSRRPGRQREVIPARHRHGRCAGLGVGEDQPIGLVVVVVVRLRAECSSRRVVEHDGDGPVLNRAGFSASRALPRAASAGTSRAVARSRAAIPGSPPRPPSAPARLPQYPNPTRPPCCTTGSRAGAPAAAGVRRSTLGRRPPRAVRSSGSRVSTGRCRPRLAGRAGGAGSTASCGRSWIVRRASTPDE